MLAWWLLFLSRSSALRAGPQPMTMVANPRLSPSLPFAPASATVSQKPVFTTTAKPELTPNELRQLEAEGSVKRQRREGRVGSAMIAVDTDIPASEVWRQIRDVSSWSQVMRGVRSSKVRERRRGVVRAGFSVTKLRIPANIVLEMPRDNEGPVRFYLDKSCTNIAVDSLDGYWLVEPIDETSTRVWLCADVAACKVVPRAAIDYVASKALGRATAWLSRVDDDRGTTTN